MAQLDAETTARIRERNREANEGATVEDVRWALAPWHEIWDCIIGYCSFDPKTRIFYLKIVRQICLWMGMHEDFLLEPSWPECGTWLLRPPADSEFWTELDRILLHVPKTAGTSLAKYQTSLRIGKLWHVRAMQLPQQVRSKAVGFVRNPYSRFVSLYFFQREGGFGLTPAATHRLQTEFPNFEKFVLEAPEDFWHDDSMASEPQWTWFCDRSGKLLINSENIGFFERLDEDAHRLLQAPGAEKVKVPVTNTTQHRRWRKYYKNKAVRDKIYKRFKQDFQVFGYRRSLCGRPRFAPDFSRLHPAAENALAK